VERETLEHVEQLLTEQIKERIPGDAIERVAVLQYGDDPEVEPGELVVRIYVATQGEGEERGRALHDFHVSNEETLKTLRDELLRELPEAQRLEFRTSGENGPRLAMALPRESLATKTLAGPELTPVMARLGAVDLETLDTLITAGIAGNRADAVRWAIGRIRERPAYERLRERSRELEELKTQF
jgi:hypothetical protein